MIKKIHYFNLKIQLFEESAGEKEKWYGEDDGASLVAQW